MRSRLDHGSHTFGSFVRPAERGQVSSRETGARSLVGGVCGLVHGIVVERRSDHLVEMIDVLHRCQFFDVANHPCHVCCRVIPPLFLAVAGEQPVEQTSIGAHVALPGQLQLGFGCYHDVSVASSSMWQGDGVAILIDDARWWWRGKKWCHLVSDTSYDELHEFADRAGIPRRGFQGDHYDIPEEYRTELIEAGAQHVESRELVRRLRAAGLRLSPAQRRDHTTM